MVMYMMSTQPSNVMLWNTTRHAEKNVSKFVMPQLKASSFAFLSQSIQRHAYQLRVFFIWLVRSRRRQPTAKPTWSPPRQRATVSVHQNITVAVA